MAEIIGAVAGVVALSQVVFKGVKGVYEIFNAPAEIIRLQDQLKDFIDAVESIEATAALSVSTTLPLSLGKARKVIDELHQLVTVKLMRQRNGSRLARRRAWRRHKRHIVRLHNELKEVREALLRAICTDTHSTSFRIESALTTISRQLIDGHLAIRDTEHWTENEMLGKQHTAKFGTNSTASQSISADLITTSEWPIYMLKPPLEQCHHSLESSDHGVPEAETLAGRDGSVTGLNYSQVEVFSQSNMQLATPVTSFETMSSYRPEIYTSAVLVSLFSYRNREIAATEYMRVNQYTMLFSHIPRQWVRLTVSITTSIESIYWALEKVAYTHLKTCQSLPRNVVGDLQKFLTSRHNVEQDTHLSVFLGKDQARDSGIETTRLPIRIDKPAFDAKVYLQAITNLLQHMRCPHYYDKDLVRIPVHLQSPDNCFVTYLDTGWVSEIRFGSDKTLIDSHLYVLVILHCLQGAPGISPFVGVLLDPQTNAVNAFLSELPAKGKLARILNKAKVTGQPVSQERRSRWCKEIVQCVTEIHSKRYVVGFLGESPLTGISIDANDQAILFNRFRKQYIYDSTMMNVLPPEHRSYSSLNSITATPFSDVYQLGLLLWRIASGRNTYHSGPRFGNPRGRASEHHEVDIAQYDDTILLPVLGEGVPLYLREVIAACRTENPNNRPPAWKLLEKFPDAMQDTLSNAGIENADDSSSPDMLVSQQQGSISIDKQGSPQTSSTGFMQRNLASNTTASRLTRLEDCLERYAYTSFCNLCGEETTKQHFTCNLCASGDYDVCPRCLDEGKHCLDLDHYLKEHGQGIGKERYYTGVKALGKREVVTL